MGHGIQLAFNEISLVLFTTLAPSGVVALMLMGAPLLFGRVSGEKARRIDCFMGIPLAVSMVGLVMSATHLGNPDNILYVFSRVGFSPLSNEVAGAVVFLALAGAYWLYSFARAPRTGVKRALTVALWCSGAAFLVLMAQAYSAETIVSWNTAYVPLNMVLNGLVGGPLLALLGFRASSFSEAAVFAEISSFAKALPAASLCGVVANAVSMCLQNAGLHLVENELSTAAALVPAYGAVIAGFVAFCIVGASLCAGSRRASGRRAVALCLVGCALAFFGIFLTRMAFYAMHLTVGLGM